MRILRIPLVLLLLVSCGERTANHAQADPALTGLVTPYRSVQAGYFLDGGSVGVEIVDARGRSEFFFVSAKINEPDPYSRVFVGGTPGGKRPVRESGHSVGTKAMLVEILRGKTGRTREEDVCLAKLGGRVTDALRAAYRGLTE